MSNSSTSTPDASVLGKRAHEDSTETDANEAEHASKKMTIDDDSDDDDVGPMPLPADVSTGTKKKRKGMSYGSSFFEIPFEEITFSSPS